MADENGHFNWAVRLAYAALLSTLGFLALAMAGVVALTSSHLLNEWSWQVLAAGVMGVVGVMVAALWLAVWYGLVRVIESNENAANHSTGRLSRIETLLQVQGQSLRELVRLEGLSEQTKSLIYRERDLETLRDAFHDMLVRQQYEAAESLIQSVQDDSGYAQEAGKMKAELVDSRKGTREEKIGSAVERIDRMLEQRDWARAQRATQKLLQMFPDSPKAAAIPEKIQAAKTQQKRQLLQAYDEAVHKKDVDQSIELLKQLDQYLTPQEAAAWEESARGVFRAKLQNLGVQFALCVTDERWAEAVAVGEQIVKQYPNSRMAHEVGEKMEQLRTRASAVADAK